MFNESPRRQQTATLTRNAQMIGLYLNLYRVPLNRPGIALPRSQEARQDLIDGGFTPEQQQILQRQRLQFRENYLTIDGSHDQLPLPSHSPLFTDGQWQHYEKMREQYRYGLYDTVQTASPTDTSQFTQEQLEKLVELRNQIRRSTRNEFAGDISQIKQLRKQCEAAGITFIKKNEDGTNQKIAYDPILDVFNLFKIQAENPSALKDFRREIIKNSITNLLERYRSDRSVHRFQLKEGKLFSEYFQNEPFTKIIARGISHLQEEGSLTQIRERRELEGFEWKERYLQAAPIGAMVLFLSPPYLERYPEKFVDISIKKQDHLTGETYIEEIRFKYDSLTAHDYWNIATRLDPRYFDGFIPPSLDANPNEVMTLDAWCVGKGIPIVGESPDAVFKSLIGSIDPEKEAKIDFILKCSEHPIFDFYLPSLLESRFTAKQDWIRLGKAFQSILTFSQNARDLYDTYGNNHTVLDRMDFETAKKHVYAYIQSQKHKSVSNLALPNTVDISYERYLQQKLPPTQFQMDTLSKLQAEELAIGCGRSGNVLINEGTNTVSQEMESRAMGSLNRLNKYNTSKVVNKEKSGSKESELFQCPECNQYFVPPVGESCPPNKLSIEGFLGCGYSKKEAIAQGAAVC